MICDKEALVGYIYDELSDAERVAFEAHLDGCAACRDEVEGLRATRAHLATWAPPEPAFELPRFRVVRENEPAVPARWFRVSPAWGLAAAAVLLLAVASAIANLEIKYGSDGLTVRTGWGRSAPAPAVASPRPEVVPASASETWKADLQKVEQRLRVLEAGDRSRPAASAQMVSASRSQPSDQELLREVRAIVNQSESRQQRELAYRLAQLVRDLDAQRQNDWMRVQQGIQHTRAEMFQQREDLASYVVRVAQQSR